MIPAGSYLVVKVLDDPDLAAALERVVPTLEVEDDRVGGHSGCNRYFGQISKLAGLGLWV